MPNEREQILDSLEPLFKEAEEKGLWFYSRYQGIWFSPSELREQHKRGGVIWDAFNWDLRDPKDLLTAVEDNLKNAEATVSSVRKRMGLSH